MIQQDYYHSGDIELECGKVLKGINIRYHTSAPSPQGRRVIWICHALTANSNPQEWWDRLVGPGLFFDTERYYIICANALGSCYGTTGPSSSPGNPVSSPFNREEDAYKLNFPLITTRDLVKAHELLREHLGITSIDLLIGGSNGGYQAVEWAISNPKLIKNLVLIATGAIASPWLSAINAAQVMALEADSTFKEQRSLSGGRAGLEAARSMALISYRNYRGYALTQREEDENCLIATKAESYQRYQGKKLSARFDAYSYYSLLRGTDTHNVGRRRGGLSAELGRITAKTLCIAIESDVLFPIEELKALANAIPDASLEVINSNFGHDGFLLEDEQIAKAISDHLEI